MKQAKLQSLSRAEQSRAEQSRALDYVLVDVLFAYPKYRKQQKEEQIIS